MTTPRPIGFEHAAARGDSRVMNTIESTPSARAQEIPDSAHSIGGGRYLVNGGPVIYGGEPVNFRLEIRRPNFPMKLMGVQDMTRYLNEMEAFKQEVNVLYLDYHLVEDAFGFFRIRAPTLTQQHHRSPADTAITATITTTMPARTPSAIHDFPTPIPYGIIAPNARPMASLQNTTLVGSHIPSTELSQSPSGSDTSTIRPYDDMQGTGVLNTSPELGKLAEVFASYKKSIPGTSNSLVSSEYNRPFQPSNQVKIKKGLIESPPSSSKYKGSLYSESYSTQIQNLPDEENCALWITYLPVPTTVSDLLGKVRTGAVYAVHINDPDENHPYKAAKLIFMNHIGAELFLRQSHTIHGIEVLGQRVRVIYNKFGHRNHPHPNQSRVLQVKGPTRLISREIWDNYFNECTVYQLSNIRYLRTTGDEEAVLEYAFARLDGQAQACFLAIKKEEAFAGVIEVTYAQDPCDATSRYRY